MQKPEQEKKNSSKARVDFELAMFQAVRRGLDVESPDLLHRGGGCGGRLTSSLINLLTDAET